MDPRALTGYSNNNMTYLQIMKTIFKQTSHCVCISKFHNFSFVLNQRFLGSKCCPSFIVFLLPSTQFYAAVDAEVVKRLMMFQAPATPTVHSSGQNERSTSSAASQHSYHQSHAPLSPQSSNHSSPHHTTNSQSSQQPSQPVEFNHAINYVNKIKVRSFFFIFECQKSIGFLYLLFLLILLAMFLNCY